jgi:spermidine synthase
VGYYIGGRLAVRRPEARMMYLIILASGLAVGLSEALRHLSLPAISLSLNLLTGPLLAAGLLFFLPALLLGMVSPYAVVLQRLKGGTQGVGAAAGSIFFWSTVGSICGSLATGFVLIPHFGLTAIIVGSSLVLGLLGLIGMILSRITTRQLTTGLIVLVLMMAGHGSLALMQARGEAVMAYDGVYEHISVVDGLYNNRPTRFLRQDLSYAGAAYRDSKDLVYDYTRYGRMLTLALPQARRALVIGGGAYSVPKRLLVELPQAHIDVAEIEPSLYDLSQKYFDLVPSHRLQNHVADGRSYLARSSHRYDIIHNDAYHSIYSIPTQLMTKEFFDLVYDRLNDGGVYMMNLNGNLNPVAPSYSLSAIKTFRAAFPHSHLIKVDSPYTSQVQNLMLVGVKGDRSINWTQIMAASGDSFLEAGATKMIDTSRLDLRSQIIYTDNYAPVEYYMARNLILPYMDVL